MKSSVLVRWYVYGEKVQGSAGLQFRIVEYNGIENEVFTTSRKDLINGLTEFTINVRDLQNARGRGFPENARLLLEADVIEDATGKEEKSSEDFLVFTKSPFRIDLSRSKNTYRPGMSYYLKIDMSYVNGRKAAYQKIKILCSDGNDERKMAKDEFTTNDRGQLMEPFTTGITHQHLKFKVFHIDYSGEKAIHIVKPYIGNNQMIVEKVEMENEQFIRASTNMNAFSRFSGIIMMITSRGEIVDTSFNKPTNEINMRLENSIYKKVSPGARLLAFYVDKDDNRIVADSTKFAVDPVCRGTPLELKTKKSEIYPGDRTELTVTGPNGMWVGFNIMDKALLLLNSDNVLKHDTIFQAMDSHDLGCGAGSGETSEEIFKNAGLTILTNARVTQTDLTRTSEHCNKMNRRRRRSASSLECHPEMHNCCEIGELLADGLLELKDNQLDHRNIEVDLNPRNDCMANALDIRRKKHITHACIISIYKFCFEKLSSELKDQGLEARSIFADDEQYKKDLNTIIELFNHVPAIRSRFETSFFFEEHELKNGLFKNDVKYRDSITEWSVQAIGISESEGACIAESIDVKTFKPFFIQLDLPYKATRFESFNIKATIFNYENKKQSASVYLKGATGLCYGTSPGKNSPRRRIELEPNSAHTVSFSVIPLVAGEIPVTVSAFVSSNISGKADVIEKKLHVVNEGIMETTQIHACLDPNNQMEDCRNSPQVTSNDPLYEDQPFRIYEFDLTLPAQALTGTGSATAYIESNIMDAVVAALLDGVDTIFKEPSGCGEQNMIKTAPIVYGMNYLKQTGQETAKNEETGTNWIKKGIFLEISGYQKADGSYAIWKRSPASLWLTAFVAKVFCQAEKVVDGITIKDSLLETLEYIAKNQKGAGHFVDNNPVSDNKMQGVLGKGDRKVDPSLTSFVLIALQECSGRTKDVEGVVAKAINYLENLPLDIQQHNKYLLAITTYALALSNSKKRGELMNRLLNAATNSDGMIYWSDHNGNAADVETTAYALLAFLKFDDIRTSGKIVTWLTSQRKAIGSFSSTQDTVVALQALAEYSVRTYKPEVDLNIVIRNGPTSTMVSITNDNALLQKVIPELLVKGQNNKFTVTVSGSGTARMNIELRWNRKALLNEKCYFNVSSIKINAVNPTFSGSSQDRFRIINESCDVCGRCPGDDRENENDRIDYEDVDEAVHNERSKREAGKETPQKCVTFDVKTINGVMSLMSIVRVNLETGVKAIEDDFKELISNGVIDRYEMPENGKSFVIFYVDKISLDPKKFIFRLEDHFNGSTASRQPATIVVYDYYQPEKKCIKPYGIGYIYGQEVAFRCNENNEQCECLQSLCSSPVEKELFDYTVEFSKLSKDKKAQKTKPIDMIKNYACNMEKANFVYKVTISAAHFESEIGIKYATAVIDKVISPGKVAQVPGDEITLEWKFMCRHPALKEGKTYYVIGKDPTIFNGDGDNTEARYELMGTTLVIDPNYKPFVKMVMDRFEEQMQENNGCSH
ncbi:complement C3-like [Mya arenaria]|uniref:complement C3-like n=1 Tax=Mya arenaria TaxID=6604 RepID=UPI0022E0AB26|nr:complement C3-like [Mya arenaria]